MKKTLKIGLIALGVLVLVGVGLNYYIKNQLDDLMKSRVSEQLGPEYDFTYRKSRLNFLSNRFRIVDPSISKSESDSVRWSFQANGILLTGFGVFDFILNDVLSADSIVVNNPDLKVFQLNATADKKKSKKKKNSHKPLREINFKIGHIGINDASLKYNPPGPEILESKMSILIRDISFQGYILQMVDSLKRLHIEFPNLHYTTSDSVYTVTTDLLEISKRENFTSLTNFKVESNLSPTEYDRMVHWKKPLFDIEAQKIEFSRPELLGDSIWSLSWLEVKNPQILISKDDRFPLPDRKTDLPQTGLQHMKVKFKVDSVRIDSGRVQLVNVLGGNHESEIDITSIQGILTGVQNYDYNLPAFSLNAQANMMGKAGLHVNIAYQYGDLNPFTLTGHLEDTRLEFMDSFLQKHVGITVAKGQLDRLDFNMQGNENGIGGTVDFRYQNLQIHMVDKETGKKKELLNFLSDAAGGLLFWKNNPANENLRTGNFYVERDVRKGFISQWVDGIMQGVLVTVSKVDPIKIKNIGHKEKHKHHKNEHHENKHHKKEKHIKDKK